MTLLQKLQQIERVDALIRRKIATAMRKMLYFR